MRKAKKKSDVNLNEKSSKSSAGYSRHNAFQRTIYFNILTNARSYMRSTLLVAFGAPVARNSGHTVLTRTLAARLIASFTRGTDRMTVAR